MLVLLPPSEGKTAPRRGRPLDPAALSFPGLTDTRLRVLHALIEVSGRPDATALLGVPPTLAEVVRANTRLAVAPTAAAGSVYSGVLYDALDLPGLDPSSLRRARAWIVVLSGLWGALRLRDRIPAYRLSMGAAPPPLGPLAGLWRPALAEALPAVAGRGLVVDCRSSTYAAAWRPVGPLAERTVVVGVFREVDGVRTVVSHMAKHTRGLVARQIAVEGLDPRRPEELAEALGTRFRVEFRRGGPGRMSMLDVVEPVWAPLRGRPPGTGTLRT